MKILFLGTNGWYTNENGNTACILIETNNQYIILDAGNGFYKLDKYITKDNKPISLFISHFHIDHVSGLHILAKFAFSQGLDIFLPPGRTHDFETLVNPPYTIGYQPNPKNISNHRMDIRLHELVDGKNENPFPIEVIEQFHAYKNHGYRFQLDGKSIAYSGDCGLTEQSKKLAENADILIHECSLAETNPKDVWGHVSPVQVATLAKEAQVKKLLLTHFDPVQYPTQEMRKIAEEKAKKIFPETTAATDDLVIHI